ncbi:hypothetical protein ACFCX4_35865 [Kitasatospora sp. NPDC056327]|uniref:hypothetical protein n=1 Tax=Kitasatospora sp. NPDC056327 TaxID=3345785 RepID=UPI0035D9E57E
MTDWSQLSHAYGPADDIPDLLDRIASERDAELWNDLWSAICHQGSVYSASFAALPWLAATAECGDRDQESRAVLLAGAIVAGAGEPDGAGKVRTERAEAIASVLAAVNRLLRSSTEPTEYAYLLEAMLSLEGGVAWSEDLAAGIVNEEYQIDCPGCGADVFIAFGEYGYFSSNSDYVLSGRPTETRPLRPAAPADLDALGRRLHGLALADGHPGVAHALTYVFGHATCPACEAGYAVADRVAAGW